MFDLSTYSLALISLGAIGFGIYLLVIGGDWAVNSSVWVAEKSGLTKMFIGATIVAFGTSAPELFTSINANMKGFPGISLGNVIGSNIANVLLVLGVAALISPILFDRKQVKTDIVVMLLSTIALLFGMYLGLFSRIFGLILLASLVTYIVIQYRNNKIDPDDVEDVEYSSNFEAISKLILGFIALLVGSEVLVQGAVAGGIALGIPETIIGMTIIAFGTSLPELAACVAAARLKQTDIIIGGIIGSNIFNILSIIGFTSLIKPLEVVKDIELFDISILIASTLIISAILVFRNSFGRMVGIAFLATYLIFIFKQFII